VTRALRHDKDLFEVAVQPAVRRRSMGRRFVASHLEAARMIGPIEKGVEICGLTNGQFSMVDMLRHVLDQIGPADLSISTWTMGMYDQQEALAFYRDGRIRSARWIVDRSFFGRKPEIAGPLVAAFGVDSFRSCRTHAKFAVLTNDDWSVVMRSSMNLNRNERVENFDISESPELAAFFLALVDDVFKAPAGLDGEVRSKRFFEGLVKKAAEADQRAVESWDDVLGVEVGDAGGLGEMGELDVAEV
jgi:hypothetical protein